MADRAQQPRVTPVRAFDHPGDTRPNIPTAELESFARPEEKRPAIVRYPRDPSLDPQLVWKGKDEQDARDLEVPAVPIYIQETIDPLALVEELRAASQGLRSEEQLGFFAPYTDLTFEEKVDFYRHAGKWTNWQALHTSVHLHMGGANYWAGLRDLEREDLFGGLLYMSQALAEDERSGGKRVTPASLFISLDSTNRNQAAFERVREYSGIVQAFLKEYRDLGHGALTNRQFSARLRKRPGAALAFFHVVAQFPVVTHVSTRRARSHSFAGLAYSLPLLELCLVFEEILAPKLPGHPRTLGDMIPAYRAPCVTLTRDDIRISNRAANASLMNSVLNLLDRQKLVGRRRRLSPQERDVLLVHAVRNGSAHRADRSLVFAERFEDIAKHLVFATFYLVERLYRA